MADTEETKAAPSWEEMGQEQLRLYAQDLAEIYRKEHQVRRELEATNRELENRVRELSALNAMFQEHLNARFQAEDVLRKILAGMSGMAAEVQEALAKIDSLAMLYGDGKAKR